MGWQNIARFSVYKGEIRQPRSWALKLWKLLPLRFFSWERIFRLLALASLCLMAAMAYYFWCDLYALFTGGLTSWDDARGLGLFIGGIIAPFVTFLGLDLASQRVRGQDRQTNELQKQNLAHDEEKPITRLCQALDLIEQDAETKRIVGLALLRQPGLSIERATLDAAYSALESFTLRKSGGPQKITKDRWKSLEASEAFKSFLYLSNLRSEVGLTRSRVRRGYFGSIRVENLNINAQVTFSLCDFSKARFYQSNITSIRFAFCNFSQAKFEKFSFKGVAFWGCNISDTEFEEGDAVEFSTLLRNCWYFADSSPIVPHGTLLPVPCVEDENQPLGRRQMTVEDARQNAYEALVPQYSKNGDLTGMLYETDEDGFHF
ncbi:MAG: pentapeptide repeat-containing protein [Candidatus Puniceispirillaceae bacterium]